MPEMNQVDTAVTSENFIRNAISHDLKTGKYQGRVHTRFPPEPNGYLHIGHAKAVCLNFGLAEAYPEGQCNLRFDDTNPEKENKEYLEAIKEDISWLGFDWGQRLFHTSDYYQKLFEYALQLIQKGLAYVCDLGPDQIRVMRGTLTEPGKNSPHRARGVEENLRLFQQMKEGRFSDGERVLRAKIDMSSGNLNMRDPIIYRIRKISHYRTRDAWCIYPTYDYAHCMSDYLEGITHSICTLEFQDHRPLYEWYLQKLVPKPHPVQYEIARLNLNHTVTSKRKLKVLVDEGVVSGWDDPRMPTIRGLRRRGYTPTAIRKFCFRLGVTKRETIIDMTMLEDCLREDLNMSANRVMCVLNPLKVIITNYPGEQMESISVRNHPTDETRGRREIRFCRELYIERDDFMDNPPKNYRRLAPGREVRLRYGYVIRCDEVLRGEDGKITALKCSYDSKTLGGKKPADRKVKGIIHWVSASDAFKCEVRIYDRMFNDPFPIAGEKEGRDFRESLNQQSLVRMTDAYGEASLAGARHGQSFQFERLGYFSLDLDSDPAHMIFNRSVSLRDTWQSSSPRSDQ